MFFVFFSCSNIMILPSQTLMLLGCFAVFWSLYYTMELYLSRISSSKDLDLSCDVSPCIWTQHRAVPSPRQLEAGTETESSPLCGLKDTVLEGEEDDEDCSTVHRNHYNSNHIRENIGSTGQQDIGKTCYPTLIYSKI